MFLFEQVTENMAQESKVKRLLYLVDLLEDMPISTCATQASYYVFQKINQNIAMKPESECVWCVNSNYNNQTINNSSCISTVG